MTARENAFRIIKFNHPDYVMEGPPDWCLAYYGVDHEGYEGGGHECPVGSRWVDIWGTGWHKEHEGVMGFPREHPLAEPAALRDYKWPDPDDPRLCERIYRDREGWDGDEWFLVGRHRDTLWEKAYMLVGMESLMAYFYEEPEFVREVLHRIMDFQLGIAKHYLACGVEMVHTGDDLGTQLGPLLSPSTVDEFLRPEYERLFGLYKSRGVMIHHHSCGKLDSVLDLFLDLGVDILNPIQATANDLGAVRRKTQGRMALLGGVSTDTVVKGPPQRIEEEVKSRILELGLNGGYFCAPDQGMPWPEEHRVALSAAVKRWGRYPLEGR